MSSSQIASIAVLLATHNGARYIWPQLRSLRDNATDFTLHWLDDYSTDNTRNAVRACARDSGIALREYPQSDRLGIPGSYFRLLESIEADIYLFCDQDDIWQPGKLDATVESLARNVTQPALSFTDSIMFEESTPGVYRDFVSVADKIRLSEAVRESVIYAFLPGGPSAQTQGFTRPLRDLYLRHKDVARVYAAMHDWWMYDIAVASGEVTRLSDAPRVLYRNHANSFCTSLFQQSKKRLLMGWERNQLLRRLIARHCRGLLRVVDTLPAGDRLHRMLWYANLAAAIDRRQSIMSAIRLAKMGIKSTTTSLLMLTAFVLSDVKDSILEKEAIDSGLLPVAPPAGVSLDQ